MGILRKQLNLAYMKRDITLTIRMMAQSNYNKYKEYYKEYAKRSYVRERKNKRIRDQRKTPRGWAIQKYYDMKERCGTWKYYKKIKVLITRQEFIELVEGSNFKNLEQPSVDRINSKDHYRLGNIRIIEKRINDGNASRVYNRCFIDGCLNKHCQHGFCDKHFTRYIRRGTLKDMERFGDKIRNDISKSEKLELYLRGYTIDK
jgi:hypothetical protein